MKQPYRSWSGRQTSCPCCGFAVKGATFRGRCSGEVEFRDGSGMLTSTVCNLKTNHQHRACTYCSAKWAEGSLDVLVDANKDAILADTKRALTDAFPDRGEDLFEKLKALLR